MKKVKSTILMMTVLATAFTFSSCSEQKKEAKQEEVKTEEKNEPAKSEMPEMNSSELSFKSESLKEAFQHYIHVRTALTNTDAEEAKKGGQMLLKTLESVEGSDRALIATVIIANTTDIEVQRVGFSDLSEAMIILTKGNIASGSLYLAHCPMAKENMGANWISSTDEIMNPYFGDKMMKCGSITETLN